LHNQRRRKELFCCYLDLSVTALIQISQPSKYAWWAASFFFWGIYELADFGPMSAESIFRLLGALCDLIAGAVLALFGWKLLNAKDQSFPPPPP
jgi:hypothetical protein